MYRGCTGDKQGMHRGYMGDKQEGHCMCRVGLLVLGVNLETASLFCNLQNRLQPRLNIKSVGKAVFGAGTQSRGIHGKTFGMHKRQKMSFAIHTI